jgi:hypothetical protein
MHRLYSMFPSGFPGVGLVLLRVAVAITLWPLPETLRTWPLGHLLTWCDAALCIALGAGLFTPITALLCVLLKCLELVTPGTAPLEYLSAAALASLALVFLGPGAYSLDSQLYGRRELTLHSKR